MLPRGPREDAAIPSFVNRAQDAARASIAAQRDAIEAVARAIHSDPEPPGNEQRAVERLASVLAARGFEIERGLAGIPTAFRANYQHLDSEQMRKGLRHPHIAILAEYHAEPGTGHTFGRNLNAGAALALALALANAADIANGYISLVGCPGEISGSSKVALSRAGVFDQADVALGARPAPTGEGAFFTTDSSGNTLAGVDGSVRFLAGDDTGSASDATREFHTAVEALRADFGEGESLMLLDREDGAGASVLIRAPRLARVEELVGWLRARAVVAAEAHGATADIMLQPAIPEMLVSRVLIRRARTHAGMLGLRLDNPRRASPGEPRDWGAVSYITPAADCWFPISRDPVARGTTAFAEAANTPESYDQMFLAATAIALAGVDVLTDVNLRAIADNMLVRALAERGIERTHRRWSGVHAVLPKTNVNGSQTVPIPDAPG